MANQTVFRRYELKYLIRTEQMEQLLAAIGPHMRPDVHGRSTVSNLYFDTQSCRLIRRSLEKPLYKEKLRIRGYGSVQPESPVFVELKKKYDRVVYKRRVELPLQQALNWLCGGESPTQKGQICREIDSFLHFYEDLRPMAFLSYERQAFYGREDSNLRVTFDRQILCRWEELSFSGGVYGQPLLKPDAVLMEIKCMGGMPLWLVRLLSGERIYKTGFSKYGTAYTQRFLSQKEEMNHVGRNVSGTF